MKRSIELLDKDYLLAIVFVMSIYSNNVPVKSVNGVHCVGFENLEMER